jgi:hypothetical protein
VDEVEVTDLTEFASAVLEPIKTMPSKHFWFRGCRSRNDSLIPSLFRHPSLHGPAELLGLETRLLVRFRQRSLPFLDWPLDDEWDLLFLMQHYGVPTRLLDWSENAYVALWFALIGMNGTTPAVVWMLDPEKWNQQVLAHQSFAGGVLSVGDRQLMGYAPGAALDEMNTAPVALYGTHNSPRIVAQRGVFTVAGKQIDSMELFLANFADSSGCLTALTIKGANCESMLAQLRGVGFSESMIFPDLEGLARELRTSEGF